MQVNFSWLAKYSKPSPQIVGLVLAGVIGIGGIVAYVSNRPRQRHLKAQTVPVKVEDLQVRISTSGSIVPVQEVNLSPKAAGQLAKLYVDQGYHVQQGQVIAQMDDRNIQAQLTTLQYAIKRI